MLFASSEPLKPAVSSSHGSAGLNTGFRAHVLGSIPLGGISFSLFLFSFLSSFSSSFPPFLLFRPSPLSLRCFPSRKKFQPSGLGFFFFSKAEKPHIGFLRKIPGHSSPFPSSSSSISSKQRRGKGAWGRRHHGAFVVVAAALLSGLREKNSWAFKPLSFFLLL